MDIPLNFPSLLLFKALELIRSSRPTLCDLTSRLPKAGGNLPGIDVPERM